MSTSNVHTLMNMVKDFIPAVDTAYDNLSVSNGFYKYIPKIKMNATATFFVDEAYSQLSDKDFRLAVEYLTQAIAFAENNSQTLSECYFERANILQSIDYWETAGEDMKKSMKHHNIDLTTERFVEDLRRMFGKNARREYRLPVRKLPQIPDHERNESFPCSTINIKIVDGETKGQRIIADSRLHISEIIVVEKPIVIASGEHESILYCHECMKFCLNSVPCSSCSRVTFCGETCKESAWRRYHKYECFIQYITEKHKQYRLAVKIALSFHDYINVQDDSHCPEGYKDILNREYSSEDISDETKNDFALFAAQVFHGLKEYTTFFTDITNPEKFDIFKGLFMKLMLVVSEYQYKFNGRYNYFSKEACKEFTITSHGIYPFTMQFRSGCSPNISAHCCETFLVVRTLRVIKPGEELFIAGNYLYATLPKEERQAIFQSKYSTVCRCEACENNWPLGEDLERICRPSVTFSLHLLLMRLRRTRYLDIFIEHAHARAKDYVGVYLVGPSLEYFYWLYLLYSLHGNLCRNCENVRDFLRRSGRQRDRSSEL